jgi:exopolysaccharide production protein ExoY
MLTPVSIKGDSMIYDAVEATPRQDLAAQGQTLGYTPARASGPGWSGRVVKRTLDVVLAGAALLLIAPIMVLITVAVCLASPGWPLFGQQRLGRGGRVFRCWKFRSMHRDAEGILRRDPELYASYVANDYKLECEDDPRVTAIGHLLRKTSLDELPQLFNVLMGQMSMVGPRPVVAAELEHCYGPWMVEYLAVRPGITGPWQISGRNDIRYPERAAIDAHYVNTWSLRRDLSIIARTPRALLRGTGPVAGTSADIIRLHGAYELDINPAVADQ